jgi:hypothetical protein
MNVILRLPFVWKAVTWKCPGKRGIHKNDEKSHHPRRYSSISPLTFIVPSSTYTINKMIKELVDKQVMELKKLWANKRQLTFQVLNLAMIVFSALMIWKGLMFITKVCLAG